ncbi:MAG: histidine ammonia-lyase [Candidatus Aminicenantes bacterium]|nr:histidine ammonia-lyase [Candidatus Aminicenantes bacterium]
MLINIDGNKLTIDEFLKITKDGARVGLTDEAKSGIQLARKTLEDFIKTGKAYYGINTGFGALASKRINSSDLKQLQRNLIKSHTAGIGDPLPDHVVRGTILLRANVLAKGYSGVRLKVVELLLELLNREILPILPAKGSVGASGDLAPLSHLALALLGEGNVKFKGEIREASDVFREEGITPLELVEKEGLALINGTQVLTAIGIFNLVDSENLVKTADIAGALTFEAQLGNPSPFFEEIQMVRSYSGQINTAKNIMRLIKDSPLWASHSGRNKVQDAYSVRCIPQVHGAVRDTLDHVRRTLEIEINSATENPLIFPEKKKILSGGNFHGAPVAFVMDFMSIAMTELGNISERRIDRVINPATNMDLPPFLIEDNGLNSGFMIAHVTATALTSENRTLAHPASVDNIPTSANQEDHVSMGNFAARKAGEIVGNVKYILAIELMASLQALDFYKEKTSPKLEKVKSVVRSKVPFLEQDSRMDVLFESIVNMINSGEIVKAAE